MPIFEYECPVCSYTREEIQNRDEPAPLCPDCTVPDGAEHVTMQKKLSTGTGLQFKGPGWYVNDYKGK